VAYYDGLAELGINADQLEWHPAPEHIGNVEVTEDADERGLSFSEVRDALARRYGVSANKIDITFRG
jgi:hypothetical protein